MASLSQPSPRPPQSDNPIGRWAPIALILAVSIMAYALGLGKLLSFDLLAQYYDTLKNAVAAHLALSLLLYIVLYTIMTALALPAALFVTISGGLLFGWLTGGAASVVGATLGATLLFVIARTSLGRGLADRAGPWLEKLRGGFAKDAFNYLLFLRLVPAFPFVIVNLVAAVLDMPLQSYVLATFLGIIPGTFTFAYVGTGLESVIAAATKAYQTCLAGHDAVSAASNCHLTVNPGELITPQISVALAAVAALSLLPIVIKRLSAKRALV